MAYDNTNRGALFTNSKKKTDKHPDYNGSLNVGGKDYWISGWINTSEKGVKYMSLSVNEKEDRAEPPSVPGIDQPDYPHEPAGYDEDDIPFR